MSKKILKLSGTCLSVSGTCLSAMMVGCNVSEPPPFDPRTLHSPSATAPAKSNRAKRPLPTTLESPFLTQGNSTTTPPRATTAPATGPSLESDIVIRMPLQEVMQRAVANNLDVKVAGYQPAIDETRVTEAEARFDPSFFRESELPAGRSA